MENIRKRKWGESTQGIMCKIASQIERRQTLTEKGKLILLLVTLKCSWNYVTAKTKITNLTST